MIAYLEDKFGTRLATLYVEKFIGARRIGTILSHEFPSEALSLFAELQEIVDTQALTHVDEQMQLINALAYRVGSDSFDESQEIYDLFVNFWENRWTFSFYIRD